VLAPADVLEQSSDASRSGASNREHSLSVI
jgi:hypothetical protein